MRSRRVLDSLRSCGAIQYDNTLSRCDVVSISATNYWIDWAIYNRTVTKYLYSHRGKVYFIDDLDGWREYSYVYARHARICKISARTGLKYARVRFTLFRCIPINYLSHRGIIAADK